MKTKWMAVDKTQSILFQSDNQYHSFSVSIDMKLNNSSMATEKNITGAYFIYIKVFIAFAEHPYCILLRDTFLNGKMNNDVYHCHYYYYHWAMFVLTKNICILGWAITSFIFCGKSVPIGKKLWNHCVYLSFAALQHCCHLIYCNWTLVALWRADVINNKLQSFIQNNGVIRFGHCIFLQIWKYLNFFIHIKACITVLAIKYKCLVGFGGKTDVCINHFT